MRVNHASRGPRAEHAHHTRTRTRTRARTRARPRQPRQSSGLVAVHAGEPSEHRAQPVEQRHHRFDLGIGSKSQDCNRLQGGCRLGLVARYIGSRGRRDRPRWLQRPHWELHAVDFDVVLSTGESVRVLTTELVMLPHPPRILRQEVPVPLEPGDSTDSKAWIYSEEVVSPGDEVEVAGTLRFVVDPAGYSASDHQPRMVSLLTGDPSAPAVLRPRAGRAQPAVRGSGGRLLTTRE